jgi:L-lactate dehydrogenase complex protein LldG
MVAAVGVTGAALAVAETGSLVVTPGPGAPRAASLVPPVHVCLVATPTIVGTIEEAILRLASLGPDALPSAITWVGGPSRTSDLEMRPTFGIHGPRTVEVVLVEPGGADAGR